MTKLCFFGTVLLETVLEPRLLIELKRETPGQEINYSKFIYSGHTHQVKSGEIK